MLNKLYVKNPRDIPEGVHILRYSPDAEKPEDDLVWNDRDEFVKPPKMDQESVDRWIENGFLSTVPPEVEDLPESEDNDSG